jgi:phosphate transport system substrate-binding protein
MSGAFEAVIREVNAICYTVFYYKETMLKDAATKSIAINGVFPNRENISNNTYPLVSDVYATIRSDLDTSSTAYRLYELYQTETGREIISESGYLLK